MQSGCKKWKCSAGKIGNLPVDWGGLWERGLEKTKAELGGGPGELEGPVVRGSGPSRSCKGATEKKPRLVLQLHSSATVDLLNPSHSFLLVDGDKHSTAQRVN